MKHINRLLIILFNMCLLIVTIMIPALTIAATPEYYYDQFEKNGIYAEIDENGNERRRILWFTGGKEDAYATFSDEQLNVMINHIVDYLFTDQESFALQMDQVKLNGKMTDDVEIFGEIAVGHMVDVKNLMKVCKAVAIVSAVAVVAIGIYFGFRLKRGEGGELLKYSLIFYGVFFGLMLVFCLWSLIVLLTKEEFSIFGFTRELWANFHHLIFPFQPEKFANSFFNDTLTVILTLDLFMSAVYIVLGIVVGVLLVWLLIAGFLDAKIKKKEIE